MKPFNILVITYWSFDNALIHTYTLPYVQQIKARLPAGSRIYLFTLSQADISASPAVVKLRRDLEAQGIFVLDFNYRKFGLLMALKLAGMLAYLAAFTVAKRIRTLHAWCTPGGAIGYIISVLTGKPLVLDSFEPHAETMVEGGTWRRNSLAFRLLFKLERLQLKRATEVICAAKGMIGHSQQVYGIRKPRYFVKPACVDLDLFSPAQAPAQIGQPLKSHVCVYAGKFGSIYLEREVFDFFKVAYDHWQGDFSVLLLTSHSDQEIRNYCELSGLPPEVVVKKFVPHREVPNYMRLGHFGICPVKPLPSKQYCTPIKNGEYWAMGLPVVITQHISEDSDIIESRDAGYVLKSLDREEYLSAVKKIDALLLQKDLSQKIRDIAIEKRSFGISAAIYGSLYP